MKLGPLINQARFKISKPTYLAFSDI